MNISADTFVNGYVVDVWLSLWSSTPPLLVYTSLFVPVPYCSHYDGSVDNLGLGLMKSSALLFLVRITLLLTLLTYVTWKAEGRRPWEGGERDKWEKSVTDRENATMKSLQCMLTEIIVIIIIIIIEKKQTRIETNRQTNKHI